MSATILRLVTSVGAGVCAVVIGRQSWGFKLLHKHSAVTCFVSVKQLIKKQTGQKNKDMNIHQWDKICIKRQKTPFGKKKKKRFSLGFYFLADPCPVWYWEAGFMIYSAASHQGVIKIFWLHFWGALILTLDDIFILYVDPVATLQQFRQKMRNLTTSN